MKINRAFLMWACGAAGSALPWHGRGRRFDPDQVHQKSSIARLLARSRVPAPPGRSSGSIPTQVHQSSLKFIKVLKNLKFAAHLCVTACQWLEITVLQSWEFVQFALRSR